MKILVTGAGGMLGRDIEKSLGGQHELVLTDVTGDLRYMDITDTDQVMATVHQCRPQLVIHTAAYTDVDGCERDPDTAYRVNAFGVWNVAAACQAQGSTMLYVSTDFVFDGAKGEPYTEYDAPNPLGIYGASKLAGEMHVRALCPRHYIIRTAWLYGTQGKNFPKTIINAASSRKELKVVADQVGSPTFTADLADAIRELIRTPLYGDYHITNRGSCTWHEFALKILEYAGMNDVEVTPIRSEEWPTPTRRPAYSVLRHYSLEMQGRDNLRHWEDALRDFITCLSSGERTVADL